MKTPNPESQVTRTGKYRDVMSIGGRVVGEPTTLERHLLYVVPIPGETSWARASYDEDTSSTIEAPPSSESGKSKRERDEAGEMEVELPHSFRIKSVLIPC